MAELVVSFVLENLSSLIREKVQLLSGVKKEMEQLQSRLSAIQAVLEDAEQKRLTNELLQNWLKKLKDAAYEADDILDDFLTHQSLPMNKVRFSSCSPMNLKFRHKIGKKIKDINERLNRIVEERKDFDLHENIVNRQRSLIEMRETSSNLPDSRLYGRDEDEKNIVKILVDDVQERENVSVYPIIGIGGLGKTTLAQMVFDNGRVKSHFEPRIWVYVSENFDRTRLIRLMIESVKGEAPKETSLENLERHLKDILKGKRYLIILDDVWNENQDEWDQLKSVLKCGSEGSFIIVTTRLQPVASIMGTHPPHCLSQLSENDCWLLFKQRAFGQTNEEKPNLVAIGREIVKKCGGLPLAAKALGGLLRFKREEKEWFSIQNSEIWNLPTNNENPVLPSLRLSYYNLPLELRRCFAFCAVFPKGLEINKDYLILFWMAHGLISSNETMDLEDSGNSIWEELHLRSFFQDVHKNENGNITFKMHDLVHDLVQFIMKDECQVMRSRGSNNIPKQGIRHVTFVDFLSVERTFTQIIHEAKSIRTIIQSDEDLKFWNDNEDLKFWNANKLRVVDARGNEIRKIPSSIANLKHLRYLDLSGNGELKRLPESICYLHNLQTLRLNGCRSLKRLPKKMKFLKNLRHLYLEGCNSIDKMPAGLGQLTLLKTLSLFVVGKSEGQQLTELENLDLGGELHIKHLERVRNANDARLVNLDRKCKLRVIHLSWGNNVCNNNVKLQSNTDQEEILEALQPHPNIEGIRIQNYGGAHFPGWLMRAGLVLNGVTEIRLIDCRNCVALPAMGQFPLLRHLEIEGMELVEYIDNTEFPRGDGDSNGGGFPSLEELIIGRCKNLRGLTLRDDDDDESGRGGLLLPRLRELWIMDCPKLRLPHISSSSSADQKLNVEIWRGSDVVLSSISNLNNRLTSLRLYNYGDSVSFPEGMLHNLTALEHLSIEWCSKLEVMPRNLENLVALKYLCIHACKELVIPLPEQLGPGSLKCLGRLEIRYCGKLSSLPENLGHLTSLEELRIDECPKIASLPAGIKSLTNLRDLLIWNCSPELKRRCEKEPGEDWHKIAHVLNVHIID